MTATLHPMPVAGLAELSAARAVLATASRALRDEIEAFEAASLPATRLGQVAQDLGTLDAELGTLKRVYEQVLGTWLASGQHGERPQPPMKIAMLETRRPGLARDVDAAERNGPGAEEAHQRAAERVRQAQQHRDECVAAVAVETASEFARSVYVEKITAVLACEAVLRGLVAELSALGARGHATAGNAAQQVIELIREVRAGVRVAQNSAPARQLLDELTTNARAVL